MELLQQYPSGNQARIYEHRDIFPILSS